VSLDVPDIEPYRNPHRHADPTDGVLVRWANANQIPVPGNWWAGKGRLKDTARRSIMQRLGIPKRLSPDRAEGPLEGDR